VARLGAAVAELLAGLLQLLAQPGVLLGQLLPGGALALGVWYGLLDLVGVVVDGLGGAAGPFGLAGDVAMPAQEAGTGVADPGEQG
jgi:hypothetical protein